MSSVTCFSINPSGSTETDFKAKDGLASTTEKRCVNEYEKDKTKPTNKSSMEVSGFKGVLHP